MRWNEARQTAAIDAPLDPLRCFDMRLRHLVNEKSIAVHGRKVLPLLQDPARYTGEKIGVEYLLAQSGDVLPSDADEVSLEIDEGFENFEDITEQLTMADLDDQPVPCELSEDDSEESHVSFEKSSFLLSLTYSLTYCMVLFNSTLCFAYFNLNLK